MSAILDQRPLLIAITGPNGAGKSTFYHSHLKPAGLRFINADVLAREFDMEAYSAARLASTLRNELLEMRESFVFETVFSDPVGEKIRFLEQAAVSGYTVLLCHIGLSGAEVSDQRVSMRVSQGGHDVPPEKVISRFPRVLANLQRAVHALPHVWIFDNDDLRHPYRKIAIFEHGQRVFQSHPTPTWFDALHLP